MSSQVKGTIILDLVKQVRAARDKDWDAYFQPDDWPHLNSEVMASSWYPDDFFYRLCWAVFDVIGGRDIEVAYAYGRLTARNLVGVYRKLIVDGDPEASMINLLRFRSTFFDESFPEARKSVIEKGSGWVKYHYYLDPKIRYQPVVSPLTASVAGSLQEAAEMGGARATRAKRTEKKDYIEILIEWEV